MWHDYSIKKPHSTCFKCKTCSVHFKPGFMTASELFTDKRFHSEHFVTAHLRQQTSSAQAQLYPDNQAHSNHSHCGAAPTQHWQVKQRSPRTTLTCEDEEKWADIQSWSSCGPHGILSSRDVWDLWQAGREWGMKEGGEEWTRSRWRRRREMWLVVVTTFAREIRGASFSLHAARPLPGDTRRKKRSTWQRVWSSELPWGWGFHSVTEKLSRQTVKG